jgi:hypothetical protein
MAAPSVTYQFTNGTTADASQVNTNFSDIIDALTDGAADLDIGSLAVTSSVTLDAQTASRILITDASKVVTSADTATYPSLTELTYVKGVTSAIQTQLNTKATGTITAWGASAWTPTGAFNTNITYTGYYRRIGDTGYFRVRLAFTGVPNSITQATINLPASHTIDTAKLASGTSARQVLGYAALNDATATNTIYGLMVGYQSTTAVNLFVLNASGGGSPELVDEVAPVTIANGDSITVYFELPIVEYT